MKVSREELLHGLELVSPGLSTREVIEQSSCVVFKDGQIVTFNDEISCSYATDLKIEGAVHAASFLAILRKMQEETIEIEPKGGELIIIGKRRKAGIQMEQDITLPLDSLEKPKGWKEVHSDFLDAIKLVHQCASGDESSFTLTCINLHPKWVEASDNFRMARYVLKTGFESPVLVRRDSIKHIVSLGMSEVTQTESWVHFRNAVGLVMSCRKYVEDYPDLTPHLKVEGKSLNLPKGLKDAVERAEIFSSENAENNEVVLSLKDGKMRVQGRGSSGWYSEIKNVKYKGPELRFMISPSLMAELVSSHNECVVNESRLKVESGKFRYVATLGKVED